MGCPVAQKQKEGFVFVALDEVDSLPRVGIRKVFGLFHFFAAPEENERLTDLRQIVGVVQCAKIFVKASVERIRLAGTKVPLTNQAGRVSRPISKFSQWLASLPG